MLYRLLRILAASLPALLPVGPTHAAGPAKALPAWCDAVSGRLNSVSRELCHSFKFTPADEKSTHGNALMAYDQPPVVKKLAKAGKNPGRPARILLIGGIHGDELTSVSIVFRWLQWMEESDPGQYHWRIIPVANPDGLLASPSQRMNGRGVDLNRNFPTPDWNKDAHPYWVKRTGRDPRRYPGLSAMSEPETRWLHNQIDGFRPDLIISVHAPYGILDYDGPAHQPRRFGSLNLNRLGIYPGSLGNYGGVFKNMPVITIELPHATAMPSAREQREIWDDMLTWIRRNVASRQYS